MDSDDDYASFSQLETSSPSPQINKKLKRLKKTTTIRVSEEQDPLIDSLEEEDGVSIPALNGLYSEPVVESPQLPVEDESVDVNADEETRSVHEFGVSHGDEDRQTVKRVLGFDSVDGERDDEGGEAGGDDSDGLKKPSHLDVFGETAIRTKKRTKRMKVDGDREKLKDEVGEFGVSRVDGDRPRVKRVLAFNMINGEGEDENEGNDNDKEPLISGISGEEAKKKNKKVKIGGDEEKFKQIKSNKRAEAKEREEYLNHLHAESQRLLRETRGASFEPAPVVQKPISSVLAKIRQRKLELAKKNIRPHYENDDSSRDTTMDPDVDAPSIKRVDELVSEETSMSHSSVERSSVAPDTTESIESAEEIGREHVPTQAVLDEESKHLFRPPVEDTQDLYSENQSSDSREEEPSKQNNTFMEEDFAPSLLALNLKIDSASVPLDDSSSSSDDDDEESDKENMSPRTLGLNLKSFSNGDPVKDFVDEEAIEEDDSDNDLSRFKDTEEDDIDDAEDLKDMIATACEEKTVDSEKRHELHMKWLEQQDAFGTDKLLQKLGCGSKYAETTLLHEEDLREESEEESSDEDTEDKRPTNGARMTASKLKQMIPQMYNDKDDVYVSSDDEETEKLLVKQRLLQKAEIQAKFLSPADDANSREVFGRIKKLNIFPEPKKKAKASVYVDLMSAKTIVSSAKSSFLGKASNSSLSTSRKRVSSTMRSYIFGRDDSNSRSSILVSEDSSDTIQKEVVHTTKTFAAKFSNSQSKSSSQNTKGTNEVISAGTSLFDILRRPRLQSTSGQDDAITGPAQSIFAAFKLSHKTTVRNDKRF